MSNSKKAKQLYLGCDNTDPEMNTLMPYRYEDFRGKGMYPPLVIGMMVNHYATKSFEDDWIPMNREQFYIHKWDKEGWTSYKSAVYRLEKKGFVETKFENNQNYIRLTCDNFFDVELYRSRPLPEEV